MGVVGINGGEGRTIGDKEPAVAKGASCMVSVAATNDPEDRNGQCE